MLRRTNVAVVVGVAIAAILTFAVVAPVLMISPRAAYSMGTPPSACPNQYDYTVTSFTITANGQTYNPMSDPDLTFNADNTKGYDITFTIHPASLNQAGNISSGSIWYSSSIYGYANDVCVDGINAGQDKTITIPGIIEGQQHGKQTSDGQGLDLQQAGWSMPQYNSLNYNVKWFSPANFPTGSAPPPSSASDNSTGSSSSSQSSVPTANDSSSAGVGATTTNSSTTVPADNSTTSTASSSITTKNTATTIAWISASPVTIPNVGSTIVRQGTIASGRNSTDASSLFSAIVLPATPKIVYSGVISYASSKAAVIYMLHAFPINATQAINSTFGAPATITVNGQPYAVTSTNSGSDGQSGSTVFSGNGLLFVSRSEPFLATFTLQANVGNATVVNDFEKALG